MIGKVYKRWTIDLQGYQADCVAWECDPPCPRKKRLCVRIKSLNAEALPVMVTTGTIMETACGMAAAMIEGCLRKAREEAERRLAKCKP